MNGAEGNSAAEGVASCGEFRQVSICGLEVMAVVGVPDEERENAQRLLIDLDVIPVTPFDELNDDIARAVDYFELSRKVKAVAECGERKLIETLAVDVASAALEHEQVEEVRVRIRKFILPDTEWVAVELTRRRKERGEVEDRKA